MIASRPYTLIAELTHRCLLHCPYCSNPLDGAADRELLDAAIWELVIDDAAELGVVQLQLTGGEPLLYPQLERLVARARGCELYTSLVTSGIPLERERLFALVAYGLDHVQLSFQDADAAASDVIAGARAFEQKLEVASWVKEVSVPLTINVVLHRANVGHVAELVALAEQIGAERLELVTTRYVGFAFANRDTLVPSRSQLEGAHAAVADARERLAGVMEVAIVEPAAGTAIHVSPTGHVLGTESVRERTLAEIWRAHDHRQPVIPEPVPSQLLVSSALLRPRR